MTIWTEFAEEISQVTSAELVTNGGFGSDTRWTKASGCTITGGKLVASASTGKTYQSGGNGISLTSGKKYIISFTVTEWSAGYLRTYIQSTPVYAIRQLGGSISEGYILSNGRHVFIATCTSTNATSEFGIDMTGFTGSVDDYSIKELNTAAITYVSGASGYGELEFSYSDPLNNGVYEVKGGTDQSCNFGAFALLHALGFRFYGHFDSFFVRPASIPTGLSRAKGQLDVIPWWGLTDGFNYIGYWAPDRPYQENLYARWTRLIGAETQFWSHGHRYVDIHGSDGGSPVSYATAPYFVTDNPDLLTFTPNNEQTFDLAGALHDKDLGNPTRWNKIVNYCARYMAPVCDGNEFKNGSFDCIDGDGFGDAYLTLKGTPIVSGAAGNIASSEVVVAFTEAVAAVIRAGAPAIPGYFGGTSYAAVPAARLGILGYSGHSRPPANVMSDAIYVQVTSAYLYWGGTFPATVDGWAAKCVWPITTYMYPDLYLGGRALPMFNDFAKDKSQLQIFNDTDLAGFAMEYGPNCLANSVMITWATLLCLDKTSTYADALDDIMTNLYDDDQAVRDLFTFWGKTYCRLDVYSLKKSFDYVYAMQNGWYKTLFKKYLTITAKYIRIPVNAPVNNSYRTAISSYLSNVHATRNDGIIHAYSAIYRMGGWEQREVPLLEAYSVAELADHLELISFYNYPETSWSRGHSVETVPHPDWYDNPVAPNDADFDAEYAILETEALRSATLDDTTLVVLTGLPNLSGITTVKTHQTIDGPTRLYYVGPGTLTLTALTSGVANIVATYASGVHEIEVSNAGYFLTQFTATCDGGFIFINGHDFPRRDNATGYSYFWAPELTSGIVDIKSNNIAVLLDDSGTFDLYGETNPTYNPPENLGPGVIALNDTATHQNFLLGNVNPFISNRPDVMLAPLDLVEAEYPGLIKVTRV
jgi:hypothetical protein